MREATFTELRNQVGRMQVRLEGSADADVQAEVQIEALGSQLNTALARVASIRGWERIAFGIGLSVVGAGRYATDRSATNLAVGHTTARIAAIL